MPSPAGQAVNDYRNAAEARRRLNGTTRATTRAKARHDSAMDHADSKLRDLGEHRLRGLLQEEHGLLDRLVGIHGTRPELDARLRRVRSQIKEEVS